MQIEPQSCGCRAPRVPFPMNGERLILYSAPDGLMAMVLAWRDEEEVVLFFKSLELAGQFLHSEDAEAHRVRAEEGLTSICQSWEVSCLSTVGASIFVLSIVTRVLMYDVDAFCTKFCCLDHVHRTPFRQVLIIIEVTVDHFHHQHFPQILDAFLSGGFLVLEDYKDFLKEISCLHIQQVCAEAAHCSPSSNAFVNFPVLSKGSQLLCFLIF